jgi:hypothetical protein
MAAPTTDTKIIDPYAIGATVIIRDSAGEVLFEGEVMRDYEPELVAV